MLDDSMSFARVLVPCLLILGACPGDDSTPGTGTDASTGSDGTTTTGPDPTTMGSADTTVGDPTTTAPATDSSDGGESSSSEGGSDSSGDPPAECSGMSFTMLTSKNNDMITNLDVAGLVSCNQDITITATGGTICVADDGAGGYFYTVETIELEDVPPVSCGLAMVGLNNLSIQNIGNYMQVTVETTGGPMIGNQSIQVIGDVEGSALGMPVGPTPLMDFTGVLPEGDAAFGPADTTATYADDMTVVATAMPEVMPGVTVTVTLTGLEGSLTFSM